VYGSPLESNDGQTNTVGEESRTGKGRLEKTNAKVFFCNQLCGRYCDSNPVKVPLCDCVNETIK